jgi:hypothetical protein
MGRRRKGFGVYGMLVGAGGGPQVCTSNPWHPSNPSYPYPLRLWDQPERLCGRRPAGAR